ncbi:MFS transporter [Pseudooceanicola spongiae]|uniref:MFS transporter n=1 Tax=Pseudooceanicola spongiae TaxID=2613965 RepID=UPI001D00FFD3|nr:MFS transporter [Pseudooceanicola spongiae]
MTKAAIEAASKAEQTGAFARFCAAVGLANLGDGIAVVAWAWTASLLTRDPLWIAVLPAALRVPWVLFALPSGLLADRMDRQRLIVVCDLIRATAYGIAGGALFLSLPLPVPATGDTDTLYTSLLWLGLLIGCAEVARDNAAQSMLPAIVPRERLERANGLLGSIETVGNEMAGPAVGAFLMTLFLPSPFLMVALAFLLAALLTRSVSGTFKPPSQTGRRREWRAELIEGFRFVVHHPMLRVLVLITGVWTFFTQMALIALVLHVQENLKAGATTYGLILAVGAIGGVVGGIAVAPLRRSLPPGVLAQRMNMVAAPMFMLIAMAPWPATVAGAMFIFYFSGIVWNTLSISYRQRVVPDEIRGRVNSVYRLFAWGMMPLGLVASGGIVTLAEDLFGRETALTMPFLVAALGVLILATLSWRPLGRGFQ